MADSTPGNHQPFQVHSIDMEREAHQKVNAGNTTIQDASQTNNATKSHPYIFAVIAIFGSVITMISQIGSSSLKTVDGYAYMKFDSMIKTFIIEIFFYMVSLIVLEIVSGHGNAELEDVMNKICLLLGTLPVILELLILIQPFGWFVSFIWGLCFLCFLYKYLPKLRNSGGQAYIRFRQMLKDWNNRSEEDDNISIGDMKRTTQHQSQIHTSITNSN